MKKYVKVTAIFKLMKLLEKEEIPFTVGYREEDDRIQITIPIAQKQYGFYNHISVIQSKYSYGVENDDVEMAGGFTKKESKGDEVLSTDFMDAFNRIKHYYYNKCFIRQSRALDFGGFLTNRKSFKIKMY